MNTAHWTVCQFYFWTVFSINNIIVQKNLLRTEKGLVGPSLWRSINKLISEVIWTKERIGLYSFLRNKISGLISVKKSNVYMYKIRRINKSRRKRRKASIFLLHKEIQSYILVSFIPIFLGTNFVFSLSSWHKHIPCYYLLLAIRHHLNTTWNSNE